MDTLNGGSGPILVVNTPPVESGAQTAAWRFEETYRVGGTIGVEGPTSFGYISEIAVDSQGRLAALDYQSQELRIFRPDGSHLRTLGGKGSGPGELDGAFGVIADGDDLLVPESVNGRLSVFRADSGFVTSHPTRFFSYGANGWDAVMDSAGRIGVLSSGMRAGGTGQLVVRYYDLSMAQLDTVPYRPYEELPEQLYWRISVGRSRLTLPVAFVGRPNELLDRGGALWRPDEHGDYRLKKFVPGGDTLRIVDVRRPRREVSASERDSAMAATRAMLGDRRITTEPDWSLMPEFHPGIQEIHQSEEGDLWVRTSPLSASPTLYDVLDEQGRYRGSVAIPGRVKPGVAPIVSGDQVWAVVLGELDVEAVIHGRLISIESPEE